MADIKYLSLDGLTRTVANIRSKFATELTLSVNDSSYSISLLNGIPTSTTTPTKTALSTVTINSVTATNAGLMLPAQKATLETLDSNAVTTINSGTGISVTKSGNIATVSINAANTSTIGGIKVGSVNKEASKAILTANGNKYAVHIDKDGLGYVDLPTWSNNQGTITGVTAGDGLTGGGTDGSVSLAVNPGPGIKIESDKVTLITAGDNQLGGILTGYAGTTAKTYAVKVDKNGNAYVNVPWKNDNSILTAVNYTASAETNATTDTVTVVTSVGKASGTNGTSVSGTYTTQDVCTKTYIDAVKTRVGKIETTLSGLSTAMRYIGKTTTPITDGSDIQKITINLNTVTAAQGDVVIDNTNKKEYIWNGSNWEEFGNEGNYKVKQEDVTDPTASGTSITFIDTISQDTNGVITATKKNVSFPTETILTVTTATDVVGATVVGNITVSDHEITAHTKSIVADNNTITITTTTAGQIGIKGNYTASNPIKITATNTIGLSWVTGSSSTMLKTTNAKANTFADTNVSTASIVTHNRLGLLNNSLCAEIDTITAYEIDALFS